MNLEHKHLIPADEGIGRKTPQQLLLDAVEHENLLERVVTRIVRDGVAAVERDDQNAIEEYAYMLNVAWKDHKDAQRWANHHRQAVREHLRAESAANAADTNDLGAAA